MGLDIAIASAVVEIITLIFFLRFMSKCFQNQKRDC